MVDLYSHLFTAEQALILLLSIIISRPLLLPHPLVKNPLPLRLMPCGYTNIPPPHHSSLLYQAHPGSLQSPEWWLTPKPLNFLTILSPPTFSFVLYFALWNCFSSHITNISLPFPNHRFLHYSLLGQLFPLCSFSNLFGIPRPKSSPVTLFTLSSPWFLTQLWLDGQSFQSVFCKYLCLLCPSDLLSLLWPNPTWLTSTINKSHIE